ncbi:MAG: bifunctional adenosylcobinamide kinase/adenosylcobinamide-phosphate guanylyltransferase [Synergistaceae bacterium]|nr:bifunctional adenosylcobinamide kinase/adenosylcobinamide-phosphate guanylyltransferase [Synergistaceae bacterium]
MGKRIYAEKLYGKFENVCNFEFDEIKVPGLIINLHFGIKNLILNGSNALEYFNDRIEILKHCVITGDEISGGVIPVDKLERLWRDETGKIYQYLANEADIVDRIFAGLAIRLKG